MYKLTTVVFGSYLIMTPLTTTGFLFNKRNRDITNAVITASFSPLFDKWINEMTEKSPSLIKEVVIEETDAGAEKSKDEFYKNPIYDIISTPMTTSRPITIPSLLSVPPFDSHLKTTNNKIYYIIETDPALNSNNAFSLKNNKNEGAFIITGEIVIAFLLIAILLELQKLATIQRNINN